MKKTNTAKATTSTSTRKPAKVQTKKAQTLKIVARMEGRKTPATAAQIKAELITKVVMTKAQAATYYHQAKSGGAWR